MSRNFAIDLGWQTLLHDVGVDPQDLLRHARLPLDLFARDAPALAPEDYFRLWRSLETLSGDPDLPLRLGQAVTVESFSPPIFAAFCAPDLSAALDRLSRYKPLIGPLTLDIAPGPDATTIRFGGLESVDPPASFAATELTFLVALARKATRAHIVPLSVRMRVLPGDPAACRDYFGVPVALSRDNELTFARADMERPFLSANDRLFALFEPHLQTRLADLRRDEPFKARVRACLMETLAGGRFGMADVAGRLNVSTRTLQRRLADEGTSFQAELSDLRASLAMNYLKKTAHSSAEIAFLLGYDDPNSFFRAFQSWTGFTPETARHAFQGARH